MGSETVIVGFGDIAPVAGFSPAKRDATNLIFAGMEIAPFDPVAFRSAIFGS
jgi:hypothetical protein